MPLWTDIVDPATLTGYARASLEEYETRKGTLAGFLPNVVVFDTVARFVAGQAGLVEEAKFRAYDAEPEIGKKRPGKRVTIELPALGQNIPVTEYQQLRARNASDETILQQIQKTTRDVVTAVSDRIERLRGTVLTTGKATIDQDNFKTDDDFGRDPALTITAAKLWSDPTADHLTDIDAWVDTYTTKNGEGPGALVASTRVFRILKASPAFRTVLAGGGSRPATDAELAAILEDHGVPQMIKFDRRTSAGRVIPDDRLLLLPAPVEANGGDSELGSTFWGQTLTSMDPDYSIEDADQPGIVAGVYKNEKPPMIAEVISDAIGLPVLANANLSMAAKVL